MALQGTQRTSRLSQMQMRFQQKQQVERDQKKLDMLGTTTRTFGKMSLTTPPGGATDDAKLLTSSLGGGKVRQMFEERRERGERIGIDKAYPLKPISGNTERIIPRTEPPTSVTQTVTKKKVPTPVLNAVGRVNTTTTSDFNSRSSVDPLNNTVVMPKYNSTNRVPSLKSNGITNNNHIIPATPSPLKPVSAKFTAPSALMPETRKPIVTPPQVKTAAVSPVKKATPVANVPPAEGMEQCSICGRNFLEERIAKHETICKKTAVKKRKIFDSTKHRVQGTEAEVYVKKATKTKVKPVPEKVSAKKGNWRKKHEEFIAAIRAAKEMQAYLAKGGSLKDLPPPPPSENPDYIQCPHCSRRFNQAAAERHIPKCATMLHNKPKPKPSVVKKR